MLIFKTKQLVLSLKHNASTDGRLQINTLWGIWRTVCWFSTPGTLSSQSELSQSVTNTMSGTIKIIHACLTEAISLQNVSWSYCSFSAFLSELMLYFIIEYFRSARILFKNCQKMFLISDSDHGLYCICECSSSFTIASIYIFKLLNPSAASATETRYWNGDFERGLLTFSSTDWLWTRHLGRKNSKWFLNRTHWASF